MSGNEDIGVTRRRTLAPAGLFLMHGIGAAVIAVVAGCASTPNTPEVVATTASSTTATAPVDVRRQRDRAAACARGEGGIQLSLTDRFILLQGNICQGDNKRFKAFLSTVPPTIRVIKLASGGGNGGAAQAIGVMIREAGYDTFVDATRDRCASACTHIFAAGIERFYAGSSEIKTGRGARVGLGYHYLNSRHDQTDEEKDNIFNATAAVYLRRMLAPAGVDAVTALMSENRTTQMTWLNGDEALRAGIATSLAAPP
jgi:hypothetical protein